MAEYTSRHTGLQIDEALDSALNVKQVRGIVKMTDAGPVAAVPGEDFPVDSGSTVSVTGLLKGVRNAETNEIEVQQATAGTDYQTPLTAGVDYATPSAVANKQNKITAKSVTLDVAAWAGAAAPFTQTVTVQWATAATNIIVAPAPASLDAYGAAQVRCTEQAANSLTFACSKVPESNLTVDILIVG